MLDITDEVTYDNSIIKKEFHAHQSYSTLTYASSDEIKIAIRQQDVYTLPAESFILIEGTLTKPDGTPTTIKFINNGLAFLFEEITYHIGGVLIDRNRNCGMTSTLKGYCSLSADNVNNLGHAGWLKGLEGSQMIISTAGNFTSIIPLRLLLGFAEDYSKVIVGMSQELILTRSKSDVNALLSTGTETTYKLVLSRVSWHMPYISLSDAEKIRLYKVIKNEVDIPIPFRTWEIFEYPSLPKSSVHNWSVKTSSPMERPLYIIIGLQTGRKDSIGKDMSVFDSCHVRSVRVWLNSEVYPYEISNVDFSKKNHVIFYDQYLRFKRSYYGEYTQSLFDFHQFSNIGPLYVIDCSRQNESIKSASSDIRIEIQTATDFPDKTTAYALIINEKIVEYNPSKNLVRSVQ